MLVIQAIWLQYALFINLPTTRHMDLLDQLTVVQLINKSICCNETLRFIIIFTRSHHWITCWASWIQSICSQPISLRFSLILSSHRYVCPVVVSYLNVSLRLIAHRGVFIAKPIFAQLLKKCRSQLGSWATRRISNSFKSAWDYTDGRQTQRTSPWRA